MFEPRRRSATFDCFSLPDDQYVTGIETMFKATGVLEKFKVSPTVFRNFLTAVQSGYRNNPYHNFRHAFDVTQMTYVIVTSTKMGKTLAPLELFSLMLTAVWPQGSAAVPRCTIAHPLSYQIR